MKLGDNRMEVIVSVKLNDFFLKFCHTGNGPTVQFNHVFKSDGIFGDVEVTRIGQKEAQCVANTTIGVCDVLDNGLTEAQIAGVIGRSHPKTNDFSAVSLGCIH